MDQNNNQSRHDTLHAHHSSSCSKSLIQVDHVLWTGLELWKIPYRVTGNAQRRMLKIKKDTATTKKKGRFIKVQVVKSDNTFTPMESVAHPLTLELLDASKQVHGGKQIAVKDITDVKVGHISQTFQAFKTRYGKSAIPSSNVCFSIVCPQRTFDLYAETPSLAAMIIEALQRLMSQFMSTMRMSSPKKWTVAKLRSDMDPAMNQFHFFKAIKSGDAKTALWYIEHGVSIESMENNDKKDTALLAACRLGRINIVELALKFDAKNDPHPEFGQVKICHSLEKFYLLKGINSCSHVTTFVDFRLHYRLL